MSEVDIYTSDDDELDQLFRKVQLEEPDSDGSNSDNSDDNDSNVVSSQVLFFAAAGSPTDETLSGSSLALVDEGSNGVRHLEEGPCQRPLLSSTQPEGQPLVKYTLLTQGLATNL